MASSRGVNLSYQLPAAVSTIQSGLISSSQTAATVSALIAATDSQLLVFMKSINTTLGSGDPFSQHIHAFNAMLGFIYTGLFLSISATITSLISTEMFNELPLLAARKAHREPESMHGEGYLLESLINCLERYGMRSGLRFIYWHWFLSFISSIVWSLVSVFIYIVYEEPLATKVLLGLVFGYSIAPFFYYYLGFNGISLRGRNGSQTQNRPENTGTS